jgi:hypothetical protein
MRSLCLQVVFTTLFGLSLSSVSEALTITVTGGLGSTEAGTASGLTDEVLTPLASPPFSSGPVTATLSGATATTTYTLTNSFVLLEFDHARAGGDGAASRSFAKSEDTGVPGTLDFITDVDVMATISGIYTVTDTGAGDAVNFQASVTNANFGTTLHNTFLCSRVTPNESFTIGVAGGDTCNTISGNTTFLLEAGVLYRVNWQAFVEDFRADAGDTGATATGFVRLDFVPEPSTGLMLGLGLLGLGFARRRRLQRAASRLEQSLR